MKKMIILFGVFISIGLCFWPPNSGISQTSPTYSLTKNQQTKAKLDSMFIVIQGNLKVAQELTHSLSVGADSLDIVAHKYIEAHQEQKRHDLIYRIFHKKER